MTLSATHKIFASNLNANKFIVCTKQQEEQNTRNVTSERINKQQEQQQRKQYLRDVQLLAITVEVLCN